MLKPNLYIEVDQQYGIFTVLEESLIVDMKKF